MVVDLEEVIDNKKIYMERYKKYKEEIMRTIGLELLKLKELDDEYFHLFTVLDDNIEELSKKK
jgi:hypothetical protein